MTRILIPATLVLNKRSPHWRGHGLIRPSFPHQKQRCHHVVPKLWPFSPRTNEQNRWLRAAMLDSNMHCEQKWLSIGSVNQNFDSKHTRSEQPLTLDLGRIFLKHSLQHVSGDMVKCSLQSTYGLVGQNSGEFGADLVYHNPDINFVIKAFVFILQLFKFKI